MLISGLILLSFVGCRSNAWEGKQRAVPRDADLVFSSLPSPVTWTALPGMDSLAFPDWGQWQQSGGFPIDSSAMPVRLAFQDPVWLLIGEYPEEPPVEAQATTFYRGTSVYQLADELFMARPGDGVYLLSNQALAVEKGIHAWLNTREALSLPSALDPAATWCFSAATDSPGMYWQPEVVADSSVNSLIGFTPERVPVSEGPWVELSAILPADLQRLRSLPPAHPFAGGWKAEQAGGSFYLLPAGHSRLAGLDVLATKTYLQFTIRELLGLPVEGLESGCKAVQLGRWELLASDTDFLRQLIGRYMGGANLQSMPGMENLLAGIPPPRDVLLYERQTNGRNLLVWSENQYYSRFLPMEKDQPVSILFEYEHPRKLIRLDTCGQSLAVQDDQFRLIMLDQNLYPRWSLALSDTLLGIWQLPTSGGRRSADRLLVQTINRIWLLSKDGQVIRNEIWRQPAPATVKGTLVQFEKRGKPWLFMPLTSGRTYAVNPEGELLPGWEEGLPFGDSRFPVQYYAGERGAFILGLEGNRNLRVFDRYGKAHFPVINGDTTAASPIRIGRKKEDLRIVWLQNDGRLRIVNGQGDSFVLRVGEEGRPHDFDLVGADYLLLLGNQFLRANYQGDSFGVRRQIPLPVVCDRIYTDPISGALLGCWSEERFRFFILQGGEMKASMPFNRPPRVLEIGAEAKGLIGISERGVRIYRLP